MTMPIKTQWIDLNAQGFGGYLALPENYTNHPPKSLPAILLIQEIFGVNAHIRSVAEQYAADGFVVLAPDMFWRDGAKLEYGYTQDDMTAGFAHAGKITETQALGDMQVALNVLQQHCNGNIAAMGYCMGGRLAYFASTLAGVKAAVAYYGGGIAQNLHLSSTVQCPIMFHFAGEDKHITPEHVASVKTAFAGNSNATFFDYAGKQHGFNCWARGSYNQAAAALARGRSLAFLAQTL